MVEIKKNKHTHTH